MRRPAPASSILAILSIVLAVSTGLARTEKIWAQNLNDLHSVPLTVHMPEPEGHEPFDPRRVPQTGGGASRLLARILVKHA